MLVNSVASTSRSAAQIFVRSNVVRVPLRRTIARSSFRRAFSTYSPLHIPRMPAEYANDVQAQQQWYNSLTPEEQKQVMAEQRRAMKAQGRDFMTPVFLEPQDMQIPLNFWQRLYGRLLYFRSSDIRRFMDERWAVFGSGRVKGKDSQSVMVTRAMSRSPPNILLMQTMPEYLFPPHIFRSQSAIYGRLPSQLRDLYEDYNEAVATGNEANVQEVSKDNMLKEGLRLVKKTKDAGAYWSRERLPTYRRLFRNVDPEHVPHPPNAQVIWAVVTKLPQHPDEWFAQICVRFDMVQVLARPDKGRKVQVTRRRIVEDVVFERRGKDDLPIDETDAKQMWYCKEKVKINEVPVAFLRDMSFGDFFKRLYKGKDYSSRNIEAPKPSQS